ncbi:hypothetical protein [Acetobacter sp. UBA5411]|uniref:hypothetical protein n=1 Tax=Acetobacter sp. UBA5411 TaxID=1945905 RepID=UPI0025B95936|nr:hypothetical protein [Acetobacter sp. UBA5411]
MEIGRYRHSRFAAFFLGFQLYLLPLCGTGDVAQGVPEGTCSIFLAETGHEGMTP